MEFKKIRRRLIVTVLALLLIIGGYIGYNHYANRPAHQVVDQTESEVTQEYSEADSHESSVDMISSEEVVSSKEEISKDEKLANKDKTSSKEESVTSQKDENETNKDKKKESKHFDNQQAKTLTNEQIEENLTVKYDGGSGDAKAEISLNLPSPFDKLTVDLGDDYKEPLSNGDEFTVELTKESKEWLKDNKIKLDGDGKVKVTVSGLDLLMPFSTDLIKSAVEINFSGYDGNGRANLTCNFDEPFEELNLYITDKSKELSNGDKVTVSLTPDSVKKLEELGYDIENNGQVEYTVKGLKEAQKITKKLIEKHLVVNFRGTSGAGKARIDTTFQPPYSDYLTPEAFYAENDGKIKNNQEVKISITEEAKDKLAENGFILEKDAGTITKKVEGLKEVANKAEDIKNLSDLEAKIKENIEGKYPDSVFGAYEVKKEASYYRPFHVDNDLLEIDKANGDGTYINLYSIKAYDRNKDKLKRTIHVVSGYTDLFLDEDGNAITDDMKDYYYEFEQDYTLDSIVQLLKGYGFERVVSE